MRSLHHGDHAQLHPTR